MISTCSNLATTPKKGNEMLRLWKYSSAIFAVQAVVAGITYYFTGDVKNAAFAAAFATFAFALVTSFTFAAAFIAAFAFTLAVTPASALALTLIALTLVALVFGFAILTAFEVRECGAKEPMVLLFIAALPLGVGTIIGGVILLLRRMRVETAIA